MRVLIACEFTGVVRDAFIALGYDAVSCDLLPSERPGPHIQGDVREVLGQGWDVMIGHPPCDHLATCGARWFSGKQKEQAEGLEFFRTLLYAPIAFIAIENPVGIASTHIRPATQYIEPWQFGHGETKKTGLWLNNLPRLVPTQVVEGRSNRIHMMPGGANQARERSRTYPGIAKAFACQWGSYVARVLAGGVRPHLFFEEESNRNA